MKNYLLIISLITLFTFSPLTRAADREDVPRGGEDHPVVEVVDNSGCFVAGCHGQICTDNLTIWTTCDWADEFTCYRDAVCERRDDGKCGWRTTQELSDCLKVVDRRDEPCYTGGCFDQICANTQYASSSCNWADKYSCYSHSKCERQSNGKCNWSNTPEMQKCMKETQPRPAPCYVSGCFDQICSWDPNVWSLCEWREEYACYKNGKCERQHNGECGWMITKEIEDCFQKPDPKACYVAGCSSELCTDDASTRSSCDWQEWYSCYKDAKCERQEDGKCGWTSTPELDECLGNNHPDSEPCYVTGCSSELCTDDPNAQSDCGWKEWYGCYTNATCERQQDGKCGWTKTTELEQCIGYTQPEPEPCYVGGCSSELCTDDSSAQSDCQWKEWYSCYKDAKCERQSSGQCGWTETTDLNDCLDSYQSEPEPCYVGGCSSELCTDDSSAQSDCQWKEWYSCYKDAKCERQSSGDCGWTETSELNDCLGSYQSEPEPCYVGGCSSELCTDGPNAQSDCLWKEWYSCYKDAKCERQSNGKCDWTKTSDLNSCLGSYQSEPEPCYVGGCSSELCTDDPNAQSDCQWKEWYSCYKDAKCERQSNGKCGWTQSSDLKDCLGGYQSEPQPCYVGGCSSELCTDNPNAQSDCQWHEWYSCYKDAKCERQSNGQCGWTETSALDTCLNGNSYEPEPCYVGGCSSELCTDNPNAQSDCQWQESYSCYKDAKCERQTSGKCGWTRTSDLNQCLGGYQSEPEPKPCYVGGCSSELCTDDPSAQSDCQWNEWYSCYKDAKCERQSNGKCAWTETTDLKTCLNGNSYQPQPCYVGGCSSELCTDDPNAQSDCQWHEWYSCYKDAKCERQSGGECGWTQTSDLNECLGGNQYEPEPEPCYVGGCSSELCTDDPSAQSDCQWKEWYSCYKDAKCERQSNGKCGWTKTSDLDTCLNGNSYQPEPCYVGGCSSELCTDDPNAQSDCQWKEWYSCYKDAKCERQGSGKCGWTQTSDLNECLGSYYSEPEPCYVGGCSSELCTDDPNAQSDCQWHEWYSCYKDAKCERQRNGQCGWTQTSDLDTCLNGNSYEPAPCYVGGCSSELCTDDSSAQSDCQWKEWYSCYKDAKCERQNSGKCDWTKTSDLNQCLGGYQSQTEPEPCYVGGCSSELCTDDPNAQSDCLWREYYSCYKDAKCERQSSGDCGWTETPELEECIGPSRR